VIFLISVKNLTKRYNSSQGDIEAISGINLKVAAGEIFGIIGPSGAGKSTLIRTLNLLEKPTKGEIIIDNTELTSLSAALLRKERQKIAMIFQHFNLLSSRTVRGNVSFPLEIAGIAKKERKQRVKRLIELVGLSDRADHYPAQLSGGQKQRVGIARALANDPQVLLSDEATSSLDPESTKSILKLLSRIRDELNLTIILITHEMEVIKEVCDRVAVIEAGKIIEEGTVLEIFSKPKKPLTKKFIKSVIDFELPPRVAEYLSDSQHKPGILLRVSFLGENTHQPLISYLVKKFDIDANILYGNIDEIQRVPFGTLVIDLEGKKEKLSASIQFLQEQGLQVEVLEGESIT